uniref:RRM domain-containing protein n=1 Tax=Rhabditophanes sp. KR3021 TaxID=114890 RepID=A0AC35UAR2_9BILA
MAQDMQHVVQDVNMVDALSEECDVIAKRMKEMEKEAMAIKELQQQTEIKMNPTVVGSFPPTLTPEEKADIDNRSVYVGNVDYGTTETELQGHFERCGEVKRVTILHDKFSGQPKGFAYIEFVQEEGVGHALELYESLFRGRQITVLKKRTNKPGISTTNRFPRGGGRGIRGRFQRGLGFRGGRGRVLRPRGRGVFPNFG